MDVLPVLLLEIDGLSYPLPFGPGPSSPSSFMVALFFPGSMHTVLSLSVTILSVPMSFKFLPCKMIPDYPSVCYCLAFSVHAVINTYDNYCLSIGITLYFAVGTAPSVTHVLPCESDICPCLIIRPFSTATVCPCDLLYLFSYYYDLLNGE
jgi:hypothetical protein